MAGDGADKIEKEIRKLDYMFLKRIECNNIKLNGRFGFETTINFSKIYDLKPYLNMSFRTAVKW